MHLVGDVESCLVIHVAVLQGFQGKLLASVVTCRHALSVPAAFARIGVAQHWGYLHKNWRDLWVEQKGRREQFILCHVRRFWLREMMWRLWWRWCSVLASTSVLRIKISGCLNLSAASKWLPTWIQAGACLSCITEACGQFHVTDLARGVTV